MKRLRKRELRANALELFGGLKVDDRGQGAFEYVLLLAGILLVAVLVIVLLKSTVLPSANEQLNQSIGNWRQIVKLNCTGTNGTCTGL